MQSLIWCAMWKRHALGTRDREMFENIEEASSFWRELWETRGSGNKDATWLHRQESATSP